MLQSINLPKEKEAISKYNALSIPEPGTYEVEIQKEGTTKNGEPFIIISFVSESAVGSFVGKPSIFRNIYDYDDISSGNVVKANKTRDNWVLELVEESESN